MSFVGYTQVNSKDALEELITDASGKLTQQDQPLSSYYFLRWAYQVSGIVNQLPKEFFSPEGQVFNSTLELRWKKQNNSYTILLLSQPEQKDERFIVIPGDWKTVDRNAEFYGIKDTRFPKGFIYPDDLSIHQRYFMNTTTATVHFVALTVKSSP